MVAADRPPIPYLAATAGVTGGLVLVLEVMGSRVIGPFFGVSLFVWTSLITVTLLALAAGYYAGGRLADRRPRAGTLYGLIALAGVLVLLIPVIKTPVLSASAALGPRAGALAASAVLFGPVLVVLGCVSPYVIRLCAGSGERLGAVVGGLFAISTLGSVAGALLTGYVLIGRLGATRILVLVGACLLALAAGELIRRRRWWRAAALAVLPFLAPVPQPPGELAMPDGTRVRRVDRAESFYGTAAVVEYSFGRLATRELTIDGLVQGGIDLASGLPVYEYAYFMQHLPVALAPHGRRALVVGLGAGVLPRWYAERGIRVDVVEIDPTIAELARRHFGFLPSGRLVIADARRFLREARQRYDYVLLDVFTGDTTPAHLLTVEAFGLVRDRLAPGGVMAMNLVGSLRERTFATASVVRTLERVFDEVIVYPVFDPGDGDGTGNIVVVAHDGPRRPLDRRRLARVPVHPLAAPVVRARLGREFRLPGGVPAALITDDFNPVDVRDAWLRERLRRRILDTTRWELLLGAVPAAGATA